MPKIKMTWDSCLSEKLDIKPGQTEKDTIKQLYSKFSSPRLDDKLLLDMVRLINPEYVVTDQDRKERRHRRELSDRARGDMLRFVHRREMIMHGVKMNRGLDMLLDFSGKAEANEHNQKIIEAFKRDDMNHYISGSVELRTKYMEDFIDKITSDHGTAKLYNMTDQELAENFLNIYPLYIMGQEGGDALTRNNNKGGNYNLSQEYLKKLKDFRDAHQSQLTSLVARFNMIIDPNYELLHYERIMPDDTHTPEVVLADTSKPIVQRMKGVDQKEDDDLSMYSAIIMAFNNLRGLAWERKMDYQLRQHGVDPKNAEVYDSEGKARDYHALHGLNNAPLLRVCDKFNGKEFLLRSNGTELLDVDTAHATDLVRKSCEDLMKAMEEADPWRIRAFTGSEAYANMKKAMKDTMKMAQNMSKNPSAEERTALNDQLKELGDKAADYLKYKDTLTENTKDSERLRINAANSAIQLIKESRIIMENHRKLILENGLEGIENQNQQANKSGAAQPMNEEQLVALNKKMYDFYLKHLDYGDPMSDVATEICLGFTDITMLPEKPVEQVAKMVTFDLIMRERFLNGGAAGGPIENAYLAEPKQFCKTLAQTNALQNFAKNLDVNGIQHFLESAVGNKIMDLSNKALEDMSPQTKPQLQEDAPVISKEKAMEIN